MLKCFRIKKLIDMEALGLSRLSVVVLDMYTDVKGYSLFNIPQIRLNPQLLSYQIVLSFVNRYCMKYEV